ncbi:piggyBac transposable element-derived protein 4-like [Actinia tenebrosa]|uniref:PiggyBac transposable element-derived protein 4-like n=1 Tax=Actinia tenebrosa TaxID=6105 RepID=A0A6P8IV16_ACTTE|nr:piggyBac transposable element-derived protein 4-like [Actinia tenebrosa]
MNLVEPYTNKGYRLYVDNWYTNVPLFLKLEKKGILACGTVRGNRKYLPQDIVNAKIEHIKRMARGDSLFRQCGNLICVTWKDKKLVHLLSTLPEGPDLSQVQRKVRLQGKWEKKDFPQPKLIKMYNNHMGGVDLGDQKIATCSRLMKGNIWYYKIFFHMLEVAVLNAHILFKISTQQQNTLSQFKEKLILELIGGNTFRRQVATPSRNRLLADMRFNHSLFHHPVETDVRREYKVHTHRVLTKFECGICHVYMCAAPCFQRYHTLQEYLFDDPSREGAKRIKDVNGRPRAGPGRPPQRRSR